MGSAAPASRTSAYYGPQLYPYGPWTIAVRSARARRRSRHYVHRDATDVGRAQITSTTAWLRVTGGTGVTWSMTTFRGAHTPHASVEERRVREKTSNQSSRVRHIDNRPFHYH